MEKSLKLDAFSLLISLCMHGALLSFAGISKTLAPRTFRVVDVVPVSLDTSVESELLGVRAVKGPVEGGKGKSLLSLQGGRTSKGSKETRSPSMSATKEGELSSSSERGRRLTASFLKVSGVVSGRGKLFLSYAVGLKKGKWNKLPAIGADKLVPYLLEVRDRIMQNWKVPYIGTSGSKKVVLCITIDRAGRLIGMEVEKLSPDVSFNRSTLLAIYSSAPFSPIPENIKVNKVKIKVNFEVD